MKVIINPGTEPIDGASPEHAEANIKQFIHELMHDGGFEDLTYTRRRDMDKKGGWFAYNVSYVFDGWFRPSVMVHVPGFDPETTQKGEPWVSPRLYVDGSSWLWGLALGMADDKLRENTDDR